ncbi:MAG: radical SAM protein [Nitrospirae bacterium]|nr:MAG: radical SAM protein [Nitrospirota bacterium]
MKEKKYDKRFVKRLKLGSRYVGKYLLDDMFEAFNSGHSPLKPLDVVIERTYSCNLRCQTCFRWTSSPNEEELGLEEWTSVIERLKNWIGTFSLSITGGEPFLKSDMLDIIKYATGQGITTSVSSNGSLIDQTLADKLVASGLDALALSLNSVTPEIHDETRGCEGNFNDVMRVIRILGDRGNMWLSIGTTVMSENLGELAALAELAKEMRLDGITFQPLMETSSLPIFDVKGQSKKLPDGKYYKGLWKNIELVDGVFAKLISMKLEGYPINNSIRHLEYMRRYLKDPNDPGVCKLPCKIGSKNFLVDPFGNVRICSLMEPIGNLRNELPADVWNSEKARRQRRDIDRCGKKCRLLTCTFKDLDFSFKLRKLRKSLQVAG